MAHNQAILLTPPGAAAIAVVRVCGDRVASFLASHFDRQVVGGRCVHGRLRDGGEVIDDPLVVLADDGRSADINLHGGPWVVRTVLDLARRDGFEVVEPSTPLAGVAVDARGDVDREMLAWLPLARTELALRVLLGQPAAWARLDESVDVASEARRMLDDAAIVNLLRLPRVALVGVPNAGKSTIANRLFAEERSIVADAPGTTRDWVGEVANVNGLAVMLIDTPGRRETTDDIERRAIAISHTEVRRADLVVVVLDASRPYDPEQRALVDEHLHALVVINKTDRATGPVPIPPAVETIATDGVGIDALRAAIASRFGCDNVRADHAYCWTERQRAWLRSYV